jgi:D-inositol-3-phosphate glycosyltransferase
VIRRIALISEHASPLALLGGVDAGGQNVYVAQVARHLAARGDRVDVFTRREDRDSPEVVEHDGYRIIHVPAGPPEILPKEELLAHMPSFRDWMARRWVSAGTRYDVIHANFFMSGLVAADLKRALDVPFAITFHALGRVRREFQGASDGFPPEREAIEERVGFEADRVIAECPQDMDDLVRRYGADPRRIDIVPCGFDPEEFPELDRAHARQVLGLHPEEPVILQLGRMVPRKGVDTVIRALGRLERDAEVTARLLIVGGVSREPDPNADPELRRLLAIAEEEGIADRVTFVGRRDRNELVTYYRAADAFVSIPWYEPFGITPVEAMACGLPVIGSDVGGIKYTVRDGETGFLVRARDPDAAADRLARVLRDPALAARMGEAGRRRAYATFTWARVGSAISDVLDAIIAERAAPARDRLPAGRPVQLVGRVAAR